MLSITIRLGCKNFRLQFFEQGQGRWERDGRGAPDPFIRVTGDTIGPECPAELADGRLPSLSPETG